MNLATLKKLFPFFHHFSCNKSSANKTSETNLRDSQGAPPEFRLRIALGDSVSRRDGGRRRRSWGGNVPDGGGSSRGDLEDHDEDHEERSAHERGEFHRRRG